MFLYKSLQHKCDNSRMFWEFFFYFYNLYGPQYLIITEYEFDNSDMVGTPIEWLCVSDHIDQWNGV